jgi:hypothetical protein
MSKVIVKTLLLPGGWVYQWTFGNPSGPWTSILDSIVNWLATSSVLMELGVKKDKFSLWIYGDDTLIGFKDWDSWRPNSKIQPMLTSLFGILAGDSSYGRLSAWGEEPGATFLGCWNKDGFYGRPLAKWLDVSVLPEKNPRRDSQQMTRIKYLSFSAVCTKDNREYFRSYFVWLNRRLPQYARLEDRAVEGIVDRNVLTAHVHFSNGGVDTRQWEGGKKVRLEDCPSYSDVGRHEIEETPEGITPSSLVADWIASPPGVDHRGPSILGWKVRRIQPDKIARYRPKHLPLLRR